MTAKSNRIENEIFKELDIFEKKDYTFSSGRILGSMCTQPHPIAIKAYMKFLATNLGDPFLFPGSKEMESRLNKFILNLLHAPDKAFGHIVSGGNEGNITAMWIAKQVSGKREIILPENAHFSFQKISSLMDMKLVTTPLNKKYCIDLSELKKKINKKTAALIGIAGSTELGTIDPIPELSDLCEREGIFLHVDAAFGGFVIPFLQMLNYPIPDFDFKLNGVSTISIDAHKMGFSAIPLGILALRDKSWIEYISVKSPYISSKKQAGILGTRSGGPVAAAYAVTRYLGNHGYKNLNQQCMRVTRYTEERLQEIGLRLVVKPSINILGVKLKKLSKIVDKLEQYGWIVNKIERLSCIRIVVMPHVTKKIIDEFIPDLKRACIEVGEL